LPPGFIVLIALADSWYGWKGAFLALAACVVVMAGLIAWLYFSAAGRTARPATKHAPAKAAGSADGTQRAAPPVGKQTNLSGAQLADAILVGTDLRHANLRSADLRGADLRGATLEGADLNGADLTGALLGPLEDDHQQPAG
jgi:hypothetical protein